MIRIQNAYDLAGVLFLGIAILIAMDRGAELRWLKAVFWGLFGMSFLAGDQLGDLGNGVLVLILVALGGSGAISLRRVVAVTSSVNASNLIFLPIIVVPVLTVAGTIVLPSLMVGGRPLADPKQATVIALACAVVAGLATAAVQLRPAPLAPLREGRRLMEAVGWAAILPQLLAALGATFTLRASAMPSAKSSGACCRADAFPRWRSTALAWRPSP